MTIENLSVSDFHQLAALRYARINPIKTEYMNGRFWAFYDAQLARPVLDQFEAGSLQVDALGFCNALSRTKDLIFERERNQRANNGAHYAKYATAIR